MFLDLISCGSTKFLRLIYLVKRIMNVSLNIIPIVLVVMLSIDFGKAMMSGEDGEQKKIMKLVVKRVIFFAAIFCIPSIVSLANMLLGDLGVDFASCYNEVTYDKIQYLEGEEFLVNQAEKLVAKAEKELTMEAVENAQIYVNQIKDETLKTYLKNRLGVVIVNIEVYGEGAFSEGDKEETGDSDKEYDKISSSGSCKPGSMISVLSSEPDPSCAVNYWKNRLDVKSFIYPEKDGFKLGAWPKNHDSIPQKVSISKTYQNGALIWPVTPENGKYYFVYQHNGIDIMADFGAPIYAPASGTLRYSEWGHTKNTGVDETAYTVTIILDNPITYSGVKYDKIFLTHMSGIIERCPDGKCNKRVEQGQLIGFIGNASGDATTVGWAPHLHMTIYSDSYSNGLQTTKIQTLYGLNCGTSCKNISMKAGG